MHIGTYSVEISGNNYCKIKSDTLIIDFLDVQEQEAITSAFPNPTSGIFSIRSTFTSTNDILNIQIEIFDSYGTKIKDLYYYVNESGIINIDLSSKPTGIYFVKLSHNSINSEIFKIILIK